MLIFLSISLISAQDTPTTGFTQDDSAKIQNTLDQIPVNPNGSINSEKFTPFKSEAEEKIEKVNAVLKPISKFVFGMELGISWKFFVVLLLWIFLTALVAASLSNLVNLNALISIPSGIIISSLMMRIFGKTFQEMYDSIITTWWSSLILIFAIFIATILYSVFMKFFGDKLREKKKRETEQRREMKQNTLEKITNIKLNSRG